MPDSSTLVVPIRVAALCVGAPDAAETHGQALMADFARLPYASGGVVHNRGPYVSTRVLGRSGPFEGAVELPQGIHLHWTLPAGLTHAPQGEDGGEMTFPPVPNRWLVARMLVTEATGACQTATWVVESDRLSSTPTIAPGLAQPTVPVSAAPGQGFAYLGETFAYSGWSEAGDAVDRLSPLTAVGYGEPTFAAYYPNCAGVFGFYDPVATSLPGLNPQTQTLTYYVAGWYSDAADDPLSDGDVAPGANPFGWTWTEGETPTHTLCTGTIGGIAYDAHATYLGDTPGPLTAALGASPQEAVSAMMADALQRAYPTQDFSNAEALLNALQFGLLSRPLTPDSLEEFEEAVHAAGFDAHGAGTLWTVVDAGEGDDGEGAEATLPAALGAQLDALNTLQLRLDDLRREVDARRLQAFIDWHKYLVVSYEPQLAPDALRAKATEVRGHLSAEVAEIDALASPGGAVDALAAQVQSAADALSAALDPSLVLRGDAVAPRFQRPVDPVLVLSGPDVVPRAVPSAAGEEDGALRCRTSAELVSAVTLAAGFVPGSGAITLSNTYLAGFSTVPPGVDAGAFLDAANDAFFWSQGLQPAVAYAVSSVGGGSTNPAHMNFAGTVAALRTSAGLFVSGEPDPTATYAGTAPAPRAASAWTGTPWLPLILQYDVAYGPVHPLLPAQGDGPYGADFLLSSFAFDPDSIDLVYHGVAPETRQTYAGSVVLSAGAAVDLAGALHRWIAGTGSDDPRVAETLAAVETMPLLAQGMGGMAEEMLMRRQTLQMSVGDPLAPAPLRPFVSDMATAVGGATSLSPLPQVGFNPLRAGTLTVDRLRLVDAFGRFKDYTSPPVVVARGIAPPPSVSVPAGTAFLPPRISQGARLLFRWLSVAGAAESTSAPSTSPVFGWVVPDYLDRALVIYSADGTPLGALGLSADGGSVLWSVAPGGAWPLGMEMGTVMAGQDANLAAFASALLAGGATYFAPFFDAVREALAFALPERFREDVGTAVLLGQPLALARATLTLSLAGPAATDESWASFTAAVLGGSEDASWDGGMTDVRVPVALGAPSQLGDTLVGYWTAPGGTTDFGTFYAPAAAGWTGPVGPPSSGTVTLTPRAESAPDATVTLLLDPRGVVHATTGILPVDAVSIPPSQYADALRSLAVAFAAGPVLSGSNLPPPEGGPPPMSLVRPKVSSGAWTWVTVADGAWATTDLVDAPGDAGTLSYSPQHVSDGWMVLTAPDTSSTT